MTTRDLSAGDRVRIDAVGRRMSGCEGVVRFVGDHFARVEFDDAHDEWFPRHTVHRVGGKP